MARWWKVPHRHVVYYWHGDRLAEKKWHENIYYVYVCNFTFHFSSTEEIKRYAALYEQKIWPSTRIRNFWPGPYYGDHEESQTATDRLPLRLREGSRRLRVVKALKSALAEFEKDERNKRRRTKRRR